MTDMPPCPHAVRAILVVVAAIANSIHARKSSNAVGVANLEIFPGVFLESGMEGE